MKDPMGKYYIFGFLVMFATIFGQYRYNNLLDEKVDLRDATIAEQVIKIEELETQLINTRAMLVEQTRQLEDNIAQFAEYKARAQKVKTRIIRVPVFTELVKYLPAEVVVKRANEETNEIINDINTSATDFTGMRN